MIIYVQIPDMLSSRGSHACAVFDDKLYAIGGYAALKPLVRTPLSLIYPVAQLGNTMHTFLQVGARGQCIF